MIFHENRLPADDSHEISCLNFYFRKKHQRTGNGLAVFDPRWIWLKFK